MEIKRSSIEDDLAQEEAEFAASENAAYLNRVKFILRYKKLMAALYDVTMPFDLKKDFNATASDGMYIHDIFSSSVFLAKQVTSLKFFGDNGLQLSGSPALFDIKKMVLVFHDYFDVEYTPPSKENQTREKFSVPKIQLDYMNSNSTQAENALLERAGAAMILVQLAKEAGWKEISFPDTHDPVERYYLKTACKLLNVDCAEAADISQIPENSAFNTQLEETMESAVKRVFNSYCSDIMKSPQTSPIKPANTEAATTASAKQADASNFGDFSDKYGDEPDFKIA